MKISTDEKRIRKCLFELKKAPKKIVNVVVKAVEKERKRRRVSVCESPKSRKKVLQEEEKELSMEKREGESAGEETDR